MLGVKWRGTSRSLALACCLVGLIGAPGCDSGEKETRPQNVEGAEPVPGGTAIIALSSDPDVLNPLISAATNAGLVMAEMMAGLTEMDESLNYVPRIARSFEIAPDRKSITYHLRPWRWADGLPLTAFDVGASFDLFNDPRIASPRRSGLREIESVAVPDSYTVRYVFGRPQSDPLARSWHHILPKHLLSGLEPTNVGSWPINNEPLASGPYKLESWQRNASLSLIRNDRYPGQAPSLDRVVFRILPEATTRLVALETGEVDMVDGITPDAARRLTDSGRIRVASTGGRRFYFLSWNLRNPIFADAETRRALGLALDRPAMVANLLQGYGRPAIGPIPPVMWNHHLTLPPVARDLAAARALLAAAGWQDTDGDGIVERGGRALEFEIIAKQGDPVRENGAVIIRANLAEIGAKANLRVMEHAAGLAQVRAGRFDAYFGLQNANLFGNPAGYLRTDATDQFNFGAYSNSVVDSLLDLATGLLVRSEALPVWHELQELLVEDPPAAYLMYPDNLVGVSTRLQNVRPSLLSPFNNLTGWWIAPEDRIYRTE